MLYYKTINGQEKISDCRTIQTNEGQWISNPTLEQITAAGWLPYEPPVVPDEPKIEPELDEVIAAVKKMLASSAANLTDEEALEVAALYPSWSSKVGEQVSVGERLWYNERLYKVIQAHTIQLSWTPDVSVSLFTEVSIDEFPEWVQPTGSTDAYMIGDRITFEGNHYESLIDYNTYSPAVYPQGWREL